MATCKYCNSSFVGRSDKKYCTDLCKSRFHNKEMKSKKIISPIEKDSIGYLIEQIENRKLTLSWEWNGNVSQISSIKVPAFVKDESRKIFKKEVLTIAVGFQRWLLENKCYHIGLQWYLSRKNQTTYSIEALFNIYYTEQTI